MNYLNFIRNIQRAEKLEKQEKILLLVDMEGIIGVLRMQNMEQNVCLAYRQISIVISELNRKGYDNIVVCNIHDDGHCLDSEKIEKIGATLVQGVRELSLIVSGVSYAIMLGFHGRRECGGRFDHTFRYDIKTVHYGNYDIGEVGAFYRWLTLEGVRVLLVSGEGNFMEEIDGYLCVVHSVQTFPSTADIIEREYRNFEKALIKAMRLIHKKRDEKICSKRVRVTVCNTDVYAIMKDHPQYDAEKQEFVFSSLRDFFEQIYDFVMELNIASEKICENNVTFIEQLKHSQYGKIELESLLSDYLNKDIWEICAEDRKCMADRVGIEYEEYYNS